MILLFSIASAFLTILNLPSGVETLMSYIKSYVLTLRYELYF